MYSLVTEPNEEGKLPADVMMESKDVCLVVTDLENSTAQAEKDPGAFTKIQNIHDTVSARPAPGPKFCHLESLPSSTEMRQ